MVTHKVGDVVLLETARTAKHYGYALLDDDDTVFYVGRTCDPPGRLRAHVYSGSPLIRARLQKNKAQRMRILAGPMSEEEARGWEWATIQSLTAPGSGVTLLNQEAQPKRVGPAVRHPAVLRFAGLPSED